MQRSKIHIKQGIIIAVIIIIISIIMNLTGLYANDTANYMMYPLIIILIIIGILQYKNIIKIAQSFSQLFSHGFKTICVTALIMIGWNLLSTKVIFKENAEKIFEERIIEMRRSGIDEATIQKNKDITQKNYVLLTISSTLLLYGVTGVVGSLLGAAIAPKNKSV